MNRAAELLQVIESSHLELAGDLADRRTRVLGELAAILEGDGTEDDKTGAVCELLQAEGVVSGELSDMVEVVSEYMHVVSDESGALGDDEMRFLNDYLK